MKTPLGRGVFLVLQGIWAVDKLLATQPQASLGEFLADFVQAGHTEVFALHQVFGGSADKFTNRGDAQFCGALAGTH